MDRKIHKSALWYSISELKTKKLSMISANKKKKSILKHSTDNSMIKNKFRKWKYSSMKKDHHFSSL